LLISSLRVAELMIRDELATSAGLRKNGWPPVLDAVLM
jgi:hypothetical protein